MHFNLNKRLSMNNPICTKVRDSLQPRWGVEMEVYRPKFMSLRWIREALATNPPMLKQTKFSWVSDFVSPYLTMKLEISTDSFQPISRIDRLLLNSS